MNEPKEKVTKNGELFLIAVLLLFVAGISFELYGHYTYVPGKGTAVNRVDRFTGDTCTMPCGVDAKSAEAIARAEASPGDDGKACHTANVVRVASRMRIPPGREPYPYRAGGLERSSPIVKEWARHIVPDATELTDGHIYVFPSAAYVAVSTWSMGDSVQVCATYSKIENRPFYSVREPEDAEPADIAI